jgi:hypothetical protein
MALTQDYTEAKQGFTGQLLCANAYWRVEQVIFSKLEATATVNAYNFPGKTLLASRLLVFVPTINDQNPIKQAYLHLKTLPEFSDATDC